MTSCFSRIQKALRHLDLFPTSKLLRYNGDKEYSSTTGGMVSVVMIIIFLSLFASMGIKTIKRQIINWQSQTIREAHPSLTKIKINPKEGGMIFAVMIRNVNLSANVRMFDVRLIEDRIVEAHTYTNETEVPLVPCSDEHFSFGGKLLYSFHRKLFSAALCPPIGHQFMVEGKPASEGFKRFTVTVRRCSTQIDPNCMDDARFAAIENRLGGFLLSVPFVNTLINPGSANYREYFENDENYYRFSSAMGFRATAYIQEDTIQTDHSLMPYKDVEEEKVFHVPDRMEYFSYEKKVNMANAMIRFKKSAKRIIYRRSFNKIDTFFSYFGGILGSFIGLIQLISVYNEKAYEISLAKKVMLDSEKEEIPSKSFNMGYFILIYLKRFLDFIRVSPQWPKVDKFLKVGTEVRSQIDVTYIVRKMMFMDAVLIKLMEKKQLEAICMRERPTLDQAKEEREKHFLPQIFRRKKRKDQEAQNLSSRQKLMDDLIGFSHRDSGGAHSSIVGQANDRGNLEKEKEEDDISEIDLSELDGHERKYEFSEDRTEGREGKIIIRIRRPSESASKDLKENRESQIQRRDYD